MQYPWRGLELLLKDVELVPVAWAGGGRFLDAFVWSMEGRGASRKPMSFEGRCQILWSDLETCPSFLLIPSPETRGCLHMPKEQRDSSAIHRCPCWTELPPKNAVP